MFISVVPSVWHILVRVCCNAEFLPCFIRLDSTDSTTTSMVAVSDGGTGSEKVIIREGGQLG